MNEAELTPKQIVTELNKYIVGQSEAKKSVAIALRNRWRRKHLSEDMQDEIIPKNILLIGPRQNRNCPSFGKISWRAVY